MDDGIATGASMRASLRAVRRRKPAKLVLAVPVAAPDTLARMHDELDEAKRLSAASGTGPAAGAQVDSVEPGSFQRTPRQPAFCGLTVVNARHLGILQAR